MEGQVKQRGLSEKPLSLLSSACPIGGGASESSLLPIKKVVEQARDSP
jgi:hypothetical protein